jgi:hypothetical protein
VILDYVGYPVYAFWFTPGTNSSPTDSSKKVDIKFNDKYG